MRNTNSMSFKPSGYMVDEAWRVHRATSCDRYHGDDCTPVVVLRKGSREDAEALREAYLTTREAFRGPATPAELTEAMLGAIANLCEPEQPEQPAEPESLAVRVVDSEGDEWAKRADGRWGCLNAGGAIRTSRIWADLLADYGPVKIVGGA